MSPLRRMALVSTSLALVATGALTATTSSAASATEAGVSAAAPRLTRVHVARDHSITMPKHLRPGAHKFVVRSARSAGFQLATAKPGYTKREAVRDVNRGLNAGKVRALKRFERNITLIGGVPSSKGNPGVMWLDLEPGTYWALDTNARRSRANDVLTVHVGGREVAGSFKRGSVVRAINAVDWGKRPRSIPANGRLTFRNDSTDNHFVIISKLADGKTMKDVRTWIRQAKKGNEGPPPLDFSAPEVDTGVVSPGEQMTQKYQLSKGRHVLICFWPDADMGGMPHAFMGMYRKIVVR